MLIVSISGLDGSGKSTQIELLKKYLEAKNKSFLYFHAVDFSVANLCQKSKVKSQKSKSVTKANWLQIQLRKLALMIDIFRFRQLMKKQKVDYILSDRYFFDSVVNINFLSGKNKYRFAECFIPRPERAFYLKVSPEKIMRRERKPDQGIEYLAKKEKLYESRLKDWGMTVIDGESSQREIFEKIIFQIQNQESK